MASRGKLLSAADALGKLSRCAKKLSILGCLSVAEKRQVADAVRILNTLQSSRPCIKYKLFLHHLLGHGPHLVLLSAVALGRNIVGNMREANRARLVDLTVNEPQFADQVLRTLAIQQKIPESVDSKYLSRIVIC